MKVNLFLAWNYYFIYRTTRLFFSDIYLVNAAGRADLDCMVSGLYQLYISDMRQKKMSLATFSNYTVFSKNTMEKWDFTFSFGFITNPSVFPLSFQSQKRTHLLTYTLLSSSILELIKKKVWKTLGFFKCTGYNQKIFISLLYYSINVTGSSVQFKS